MRVTLLQDDAPRDLLDIDQARLRIDTRGPTRPVDGRVPGSEIDFAGRCQLDDGYFNPPAETAIDPSVQPIQEPELSAITKPGARRIGASGEVVPKQGQQLRKPYQSDVLEIPSQHPSDLRAGETDGSAELGMAQAKGHPSSFGLPKHVGKQAPAAQPPTRRPVLSRRHATSMWSFDRARLIRT